MMVGAIDGFFCILILSFFFFFYVTGDDGSVKLFLRLMGNTAYHFYWP